MGRQTGAVHRDVEALGDSLRRSIGRFVRAVRADAGTPQSARSEALALLEKRSAMNIATLAQLRKVTHQTMWLIAVRLEKDGLILRASDPDDRRSRLFSITAAGRESLARERQMRASRIDHLLDRHVTVEERALLSRAADILDRLSAATEG